MMAKLALFLTLGLSAALLTGGASAHQKHGNGGHLAARAYVLGFADGYARASADYRAHARRHVRRKVVRLSPGPSYYAGQIDPWWRAHGHR